MTSPDAAPAPTTPAGGGPPARGRWRARLLWVARAALALAVIAGLVLLVRRIGLRALLGVFRHADPWWVAAALLAKLAALLVASWRLRRLARPWTAVPLRDACATVVGSYATNHLFGAGWGPAYRVWGLTRAGASAAAGVTVVGAEKYLELLTFALLVMPPALLLGAPPSWRWTFWAWLAVAAGCLLAAGVAFLVARHGRRGLLARVAAELRALPRGGHLVASFGLTVLLLTLEAVIFCCAARAVGVGVGVPGLLFAFVGAELAFLVPGPPSSIGVVEAGVVVTLEAAGAGAGPALAAALLYHAVHLVTELATGLPALRAAAWRPWREGTGEGAGRTEEPVSRPDRGSA